MKTYRIAKKDNELKAINIDEKKGIDAIRLLENNGYTIATYLIEANDQTEAVQLYLEAEINNHTPSRKQQENEPTEEPEKSSKLWDIFSVLFVIAMIIVSEM